MSQENMEFVERVLGEAQHNPAALWDVLDDDVLWETGDLDIPDAETTHWRGPDAVRQFFALWVAPFDEWGYEAGEMFDAGDSILVQIHQWGRGKGSGARVESQFWQVWTIREGRIVRGTHHSEKTDALEAVGLAE